MRLVPLRIGADLFVTKIAVLSLAMGLGVGFARLATTLFALDLGAQGVTLAAIAMAQGVGMLILGAPAGRWVANYGYRTVFIAGTVWAVATCLAIPFASNPLWLIFLVAFAGLAMPLRFVSFNAFFMSHPVSEREMLCVLQYQLIFVSRRECLVNVTARGRLQRWIDRTGVVCSGHTENRL